MMVYLKVLNTIARVNRKNYQPDIKRVEQIVELPFIEKALNGIKEFQDELKKNQINKSESGSSENSQAEVSASQIG